MSLGFSTFTISESPIILVTVAVSPSPIYKDGIKNRMRDQGETKVIIVYFGVRAIV